jgi:hypothetical protein
MRKPSLANVWARCAGDGGMSTMMHRGAYGTPAEICSALAKVAVNILAIMVPDQAVRWTTAFDPD